ncbi:MAG: hypothetical protein JSV31_05070 [Desulfobacterales bacterium]|nr:MAG: hypothetical protein JSV31_05070 [Desulfobacterales bacterium]
MTNNLSETLAKIGEEYKENIQDDSRYYIEISIAQKAAELGFPEVEESYRNVYAIVPLRRPVNGMKVRVDGRTFANYAQFESGIVVPNYVARDAGLLHETFVPNDSMIRNFA